MLPCVPRDGGRKQETKEDTEWGWERGLVRAAREDDRWQRRLLPICILCILLDVFQVEANSQSTTPKQKATRAHFLGSWWSIGRWFGWWEFWEVWRCTTGMRWKRPKLMYHAENRNCQRLGCADSGQKANLTLSVGTVGNKSVSYTNSLVCQWQQNFLYAPHVLDQS